jgi:hypothetical protein
LISLANPLDLGLILLPFFANSAIIAAFLQIIAGTNGLDGGGARFSPKRVNNPDALARGLLGGLEQEFCPSPKRAPYGVTACGQLSFLPMLESRGIQKGFLMKIQSASTESYF